MPSYWHGKAARYSRARRGLASRRSDVQGARAWDLVRGNRVLECRWCISFESRGYDGDRRSPTETPRIEPSARARNLKRLTSLGWDLQLAKFENDASK